MKTLAYISKVGSNGSASFVSVNLDKGIYTKGGTAYSGFSPYNADIVAFEMPKKALNDVETDVRNNGLEFVSQGEYYNQTYKG